MAKNTMRAVVFKGPRTVAVEDRPVPKIEDERDIIVKVIYSALCGSELHVFRGHQPSPTGFIMGHEFTGTVVPQRLQPCSVVVSSLAMRMVA